MSKNTLTLKVFFFCVVNDAADSVAQILMKKGLPDSGLTGENIFRVFFQSPASGYLWLGALLYALNFLIWIVILSRLDLSTAVPVASTNYVILPVLAMIFLHERVGLLRWAGIFSVVIGIHFISKSTHTESERGSS
jgi:drug/metabolite transporter (DMT)-like permease